MPNTSDTFFATNYRPLKSIVLSCGTAILRLSIDSFTEKPNKPAFTLYLSDLRPRNSNTSSASKSLRTTFFKKLWNGSSAELIH